MNINRPLLERNVPRYTSYPTAPHFHEGVAGPELAVWLGELEPNATLSIYLHIPFCKAMCWFCGCHTSVANRYDLVASYVRDLMAELNLVADALGGSGRVRHIHFGGGSPSMLKPAGIDALAALMRERFVIEPGCEIAVEFDPRGLSPETVADFVGLGVNRASLGLQDINPVVQQAINRIQPPESNHRAVAMLRDAGVCAFNLDLIYGLPYQDEEAIAATVAHACELAPDRIALFGYAHVPQIKRHQQLIPSEALPGAEMRLAQEALAAKLLEAAGYRRIGLDHFARSDDPMAVAMDEGTLQRNFRGYTIDPAAVLIGQGASAIGSLPQGYVQNFADVPSWRDAVRRGELPVRRGAALAGDDRLRRDIINRLMCDLEVDLAVLQQQHGIDADLTVSVERLAELENAGICEIEGDSVRVAEESRPYVRLVAAAFDAYLGDNNQGRHSRAV
ncbi:MAG: oxygen-independent coproporphyrinogen III oxidase [Alphaproteobacteria bacterium]|jgi:oxygen-independent coproporphyrinogen III oxidase|nr:oxygen-independent coproporphyrinogen III oxidase [Rhodospirillaceae bacterium]MDG2480159.1 oxygen-independent coproporphyrinogen III oxidase [Alphaproteobacteria bacterium]